MPYASTLNARFVTYQWVRDGVAQRRGHSRGRPLDADQAADLAEFITSAYRRCLEKCPWPELVVGTSLTIADGLVTWAAVQGSDLANVEFWTLDPDAPCTSPHARRIERKRYDSTGLILDTHLTSVWARFTPRAPVFDSTPVADTEVYPLATVRYDDGSGHCYEAIEFDAHGAELTDATQWRPLPLLWSLTDAVKLYALADMLGNSNQERAQASDLRGQAETLLNDLAGREMRAAANS